MHSNSVIEFDGGRVEFLNYGYEYDESLAFRGFVLAMDVDSLIVRNVVFSYNIVYNGNLIQARKNVRQIVVEDCIFEYTVCDNVFRLFLLDSEFPIEIENGLSVHHSIEQVTIKNSDFSNNLTKFVV